MPKFFPTTGSRRMAGAFAGAATGGAAGASIGGSVVGGVCAVGGTTFGPVGTFLDMQLGQGQALQ